MDNDIVTELRAWADGRETPPPNTWGPALVNLLNDAADE